jgi:hypothetical protein
MYPISHLLQRISRVHASPACNAQIAPEFSRKPSLKGPINQSPPLSPAIGNNCKIATFSIALHGLANYAGVS